MSQVQHKVKIASVILAAGESKRMNGIKQLLPWKDKTLIQHAIQTSLDSEITSVFVVLGANYSKIITEIDSSKIDIIKNQQWKDGLGSSLACAIKNIEKNHPGINAVLVLLVDQPLVDIALINELIIRYINVGNIVSTRINDHSGVPAIFDQTYFKALTELKGDKGAKKIIMENNKDNTTLDFKHQFADIDTEEEYQALYKIYGQ